MKGETSGHRQWVREVRLDCDGDTVLVRSTRRARPATPATGPASTPACCSAPPRPVRTSRSRCARDRRHRPRASRRLPRGWPKTRRVIPVYRRLLGRRRDADQPLPQARREPVRHLPARVGRAGRLVALLLRRRPFRRRADRGGRPGRLAGQGAGRAADRGRSRWSAAPRRPRTMPPSNERRRGTRRERPARRCYLAEWSGYLGYDAVRRLERLPDSNPKDIDIPELAFLLASDLVVLDHYDREVWVIANVVQLGRLRRPSRRGLRRRASRGSSR